MKTLLFNLMLCCCLLALSLLASDVPIRIQLDSGLISAFKEKNTVSFTAFRRHFVVVLDPEMQLHQHFLVSSDIEHRTGPLDPSQSSHRSGTLEGVSGADVSLNFFAGGRLYGVIYIEPNTKTNRPGQTFTLETTAEGELWMTALESEFYSKSSSMSKSRTGHGSEERRAAPAGDGSQGGTPPPGYRPDNVHHQIPNRRRDSGSEDEGAAPVYHQVDYKRHQIETPEDETHSLTRRAGPASSANTACRIFLDIDSFFYGQWGVGATEAEKIQAATNKAASYINAANNIYNSNFQGSIVLEVAGAMVYTTSSFGISASETDPGNFLDGYSAWLATGSSGQVAAHVRGASLPTSQESCLNVALTNRNFGSTVGIANMGDPAPSMVGGICSNYIGFTPRQVLNTAIVTSYGPRSDSSMAKTIAHELGHAFGADHVCCDGTCTDGCNLYASCSNPYLMFYLLTSGTNSQVFSGCSKTQMSAVIQAKGSCLSVPSTTASTTTTTTQATTTTQPATTTTQAATTTTKATTTTQATTSSPTTVSSTANSSSSSSSSSTTSPATTTKVATSTTTKTTVATSGTTKTTKTTKSRKTRKTKKAKKAKKV